MIGISEKVVRAQPFSFVQAAGSHLNSGDDARSRNAAAATGPGRANTGGNHTEKKHKLMQTFSIKYGHELGDEDIKNIGPKLEGAATAKESERIIVGEIVDQMMGGSPDAKTLAKSRAVINAVMDQREGDSDDNDALFLPQGEAGEAATTATAIASETEGSSSSSTSTSTSTNTSTNTDTSTSARSDQPAQRTSAFTSTGTVIQKVTPSVVSTSSVHFTPSRKVTGFTLQRGSASAFSRLPVKKFQPISIHKIEEGGAAIGQQHTRSGNAEDIESGSGRGGQEGKNGDESDEGEDIFSKQDVPNVQSLSSSLSSSLSLSLATSHPSTVPHPIHSHGHNHSHNHSRGTAPVLGFTPVSPSASASSPSLPHLPSPHSRSHHRSPSPTASPSSSPSPRNANNAHASPSASPPLVPSSSSSSSSPSPGEGEREEPANKRTVSLELNLRQPLQAGECQDGQDPGQGPLTSASASVSADNVKDKNKGAWARGARGGTGGQFFLKVYLENNESHVIKTSPEMTLADVLDLICIKRMNSGQMNTELDHDYHSGLRRFTSMAGAVSTQAALKEAFPKHQYQFQYIEDPLLSSISPSPSPSPSPSSSPPPSTSAAAGAPASSPPPQSPSPSLPSSTTDTDTPASASTPTRDHNHDHDHNQRPASTSVSSTCSSSSSLALLAPLSMKTRIADVKRDNLRLVYKLPDMGLGKHGDRLGGPVRNHNHLRHLSNMSSASQASASSGSCLSSLSHIPSPSSSSSHAHSEHTSHHKSQLSYSSTASSTVYTPNNNTRDPVLLRSSNNPQPSDFLFDRDSATAYREYSVIKVNSRGKKESRTMGVDTHTIYNKIGRQDSKGNSSNNRRHPHHLHATTNNISSNSGGGGSVGGDNDGNNLSRSISSTLTQAASVKDKLFQGIQSKLIKRRERPIASVKQCVMLDAQAHGGNPALEITYQDAKGSPDVRVYLCETAFVCAEIVAKIRYLAGLR